MVWRTGTILACIVAAGVLAYQIGARLSDEAIMTIAGVICGIFASIPVSIGLLIALTRGRSNSDYVDCESEPRPGVIVVERPYNVSESQIHKYIAATGTVPERSITRVWHQDVNGDDCVFWQDPQTRQIHFVPIYQIGAPTDELA